MLAQKPKSLPEGRPDLIKVSEKERITLRKFSGEETDAD
jgi:hypothetical protein